MPCKKCCDSSSSSSSCSSSSSSSSWSCKSSCSSSSSSSSCFECYKKHAKQFCLQAKVTVCWNKKKGKCAKKCTCKKTFNLTRAKIVIANYRKCNKNLWFCVLDKVQKKVLKKYNGACITGARSIADVACCIARYIRKYLWCKGFRLLTVKLSDACGYIGYASPAYCGDAQDGDQDGAQNDA